MTRRRMRRLPPFFVPPFVLLILKVLKGRVRIYALPLSHFSEAGGPHV